MISKKLYLSFLCVAFFSAGAFGQWGTVSPADPNVGEVSTSITSMQLDKTHIVLGEIVKGTVVKYEIGFTNTGTDALVLEGVKPSCNCSTPEWSTDPVLPGKKGVITISYDTKDKTPGPAEGTITIIYNGMPNIEQVTFEAVVLPGEAVPDLPPQHNE
jgi:Protein of unknown function (DUF1573)